MYVDLLSSALDAWVEQLDDEELITYTLERRTEMLQTNTQSSTDVYEVIATEITYDCALIMLCKRYDIEVDVLNFRFPREERASIERQLAAQGADLALLSLEVDED